MQVRSVNRLFLITGSLARTTDLLYMGSSNEMRITMIVTTTISSTKVNPRLPIRIGRVVQPHFIGAAANVENPGLRLIDSLTRILLNGVPGLVAAGDRIDGQLDE